MWLPLLPLTVAAISPRPAVELPDQVALERALADGVRSAVAAGWTLVDVDGDGDGVSLTLAAGGWLEHHRAVIDDLDEGGAYEVVRERAAAGQHHHVDELALAMATAPRAGLEIDFACGDYVVRPYLVEDAATGAAAGRLVSARLREVTDVESATTTGDQVFFQLEHGDWYDLVVTLDDDHQVVAAELRRLDPYYEDDSTYQRGDALDRALRGRAVTAIEDDGAVLVLGDRRFELDPDGDAFAANPREEPDGCGC